MPGHQGRGTCGAAVAGAWVLLCAAPAAAQAPPVRSPTIVWAQCPGETVAPTTLARVAEAARPVLWFSRDEPLLIDSTTVLPQEWPRTIDRPASPRRMAYYRFGRLKSSRGGDIAEALRERVTPAERDFVRGTAHPEVIAGVALDPALLDQLDGFSIRYLFYYPNELGVGRHPHDLESVQLQFKVERADRRGNPWADDESTRVCRQIRVTGVYGSAHGLGAYTNVLDLNAILKERFKDPLPEGTRYIDPFWPLVIFVEEGKHASGPDRNGDGMYTPGFDVNKYDSDAWGIRDTMRANRLAPAFTGDTFKRRIPEITTDHQRVSVANPGDAWAVEAFNKYVSHDYALRRPTEDVEICGPVAPLRPVDERRAEIKAYAKRLEGIGVAGPAEEKIKEKGFCDDVELGGWFDLVDLAHAVRWGGSTVFARFGETFTVALRHDNGTGWTGLSPMEFPFPFIGGRIVGRMSTEGLSLGTKGLWDLKSVDILYMRSAAKFAEWYLAAGVDDRPPGHANAKRASVEGPPNGERYDKALELGFRVRMPIPKLGVFFGGRIAVRSNDFSTLRNIRLVTEVGSAIW